MSGRNLRSTRKGKNEDSPPTDVEVDEFPPADKSKSKKKKKKAAKKVKQVNDVQKIVAKNNDAERESFSAMEKFDGSSNSASELEEDADIILA